MNPSSDFCQPTATAKAKATAKVTATAAAAAASAECRDGATERWDRLPERRGEGVQTA